tara:strand:- start:13285 stop:13746 length:462 start_codon:yes stop_codon:yes gene_type:complete
MDDEYGVIFGDNVLPLNPPIRKDQRLYEVACEYAEADRKVEYWKEIASYHKEQLLSDLPQDVGEHEVKAHNDMGLEITLHVRVPEKWTWNKKLVKEICSAQMSNAHALPDCISTNFTVDRKKFETASPDVQDALRPALTIERGLPSIKVKLLT